MSSLCLVNAAGRLVCHEYKGGPDPPHAGQEAMHRGTGQFAGTHDYTVRGACDGSHRTNEQEVPNPPLSLEGPASRAGVQPAKPFLR